MDRAAPAPQRTPVLDELLERLRRRLVRAVWLFGTGRALAAAACWLAVSFVLDRWLDLPGGIRVAHAVLLAALPIYVLWRELWGRLRRVPDRAGLALLVERAHPDLHELLVSAVQLNEGRGDARDETLVGALLAAAERRAASLNPREVVDPRGPRRTFATGAGASVLAAGLLFAAGDLARVFFLRMGGGGPAWPQRTHLSIHVPDAGGAIGVEDAGDRLLVRVARGGDVGVVVHAEGVVPDEVILHFESGQRLVLAATGGGTFRTLLRSRQADCAFHVTGGDDTDGKPRVDVRVLQPPDVTAVAVRITPPAYTGLPERLERDRDVEVLEGSRVTVHMLSDPPEAEGAVRLLPADRLIALERRPFPHDAPEGEADAGTVEGAAFDLEVRESLRYRFEIRDETGLANPDPGLLGIAAVGDRPPQIEFLAPARAEVSTVVGGSLPLRVLAWDDFGLEELALSVELPGAEEGAEHNLPLDWTSPPAGSSDETASRGAVRAFASRRIEISDLGGDEPAGEGQLFGLRLFAVDNRRPDPQRGVSLPVRLRVVSAEEFLRRIQDRLARTRTSVGGLLELASEKHRSTLELVAAIESDQPDAVGEADGARTVLSGQRRLAGDARAVSRELAAVAEELLYSRLDDRSGPILEALDAASAHHANRSFHPGPWTELARRVAAGELGTAVFASKLVEVVGASLEIGEGHATAAIEALRSASNATDLATVHAALLAASDSQAAGIAATERLLEMLAEWDNFQSVLSLTRDILNRQKNLLERTRQYAKEN
ncbi:MAG: hypothetical protein QF903_12460 [Planctomycetota bacterium]|nr:hypothetical protein [Planctomycetota bacterium]MDP6763828.1 hypothetical protein [Planctomycetota bacterium]MDP6990273.1 hypothetical protein [Planctomycetota bacterium]